MRKANSKATKAAAPFVKSVKAINNKYPHLNMSLLVSTTSNIVKETRLQERLYPKSIAVLLICEQVNNKKAQKKRHYSPTIQVSFELEAPFSQLSNLWAATLYKSLQCFACLYKDAIETVAGLDSDTNCDCFFEDIAK